MFSKGSHVSLFNSEWQPWPSSPSPSSPSSWPLSPCPRLLVCQLLWPRKIKCSVWLRIREKESSSHSYWLLAKTLLNNNNSIGEAFFKKNYGNIHNWSDTPDLAKIMENFWKGDLVFSNMEVDTGDPPPPHPPHQVWKISIFLRLPLK